MVIAMTLPTASDSSMVLLRKFHDIESLCLEATIIIREAQ